MTMNPPYSMLVVTRSISASEVSPSRTFAMPSSRMRRIPWPTAMSAMSLRGRRPDHGLRTSSLIGITS